MTNKQVCIIPDSNIWIKTFLLKTPMAMAFLYHVVTNNYKIGLPEVVKREIILNMKKRGLQILGDVTKDLNYISFIHEKSKKLIDQLPNQDDILNSINERINELSSLLIDHTHSQSEFEGALEMVIKSTPPNSEKNQQYKDSLIWQSILNLCREFRVIFITEDKGFFEDRDYDKGLNYSLNETVKFNEYPLEIHHSLEVFTSTHKSIKETINEKEIIEKIITSAKNEIDKFLIPEGFFPKEYINSNLKYFLTNDTHKLGELYEHEDITEPTLTLKGNCLFIINKNEVSDQILDNLNFSAQRGTSRGVVSLRSKKWPSNDIKILGEI